MPITTTMLRRHPADASTSIAAGRSTSRFSLAAGATASRRKAAAASPRVISELLEGTVSTTGRPRTVVDAGVESAVHRLHASTTGPAPLFVSATHGAGPALITHRRTTGRPRQIPDQPAALDSTAETTPTREETPHMRPRTHRTLLTATAACTALLFAAVGCTSDEPSPKPPETTSSAAPSPTKPAWGSKFNAKQTAQYEAALARWTEYEQRAQPIWADGKVTPAAEKLLQEYWVTWPTQLNTLRRMEASGITVNGSPTVLSSEPIKVTIRPTATVVEFNQCIDDSTVTTASKAGTPTGGDRTPKPFIRTITMTKVAKKTWLVVSATADMKKANQCDS